MVEKAAVTLPSDREVKVVRSFKAPRTLVYRAFTEPALVRKWQLGPPGWQMPVCDMDVRVGGTYRWVWRNDADGTEFGFSGTYREVEPGVRLVQTERYEPGTLGAAFPAAESVMTIGFADDNGVTTMTTLMDYGSKDARDAAIATGMTGGMEQSYARLDTLLAEGGPSFAP